MFNTLITNLTFGNIIPWLLLGIVAAFIVHLIDQKDAHKELWITTAAGVVGALVGGLITSLFITVDSTGINTASFIMAILVGLLFSLVERIVTLSRQKPIVSDEPHYDYEAGRVAYYSQVAPLSEAEKRQYQSQPTYIPRTQPTIVKPAEMEKYLSGISFPVSKEELLNHATLLDANENILYTLDLLPDKQFFGPIALSEQLSSLS